MDHEIRSLEPVAVWTSFANLSEIPRASKKEEKIIQFMLAYGRSLGLESVQDGTGNVLIRKPATSGMEHAKPVVLQGHLDMVHQKNEDILFNFEEDGIRIFREGDWVKARGTTLGADNGMGVAAIMAILASDSIAHPELEALFTVDEETGMTGAKGFGPDILKGEILLNLDTEEDDEIDIGCAGGVDVTAHGAYGEVRAPEGYTGLLIQVNGLQGGHSGIDIHRGRGNANKILNGLLLLIQGAMPLEIGMIDGGGLRNAIPREAKAHIAIPRESLVGFEKNFEIWAEAMRESTGGTEPGLRIRYEPAENPVSIMDPESRDRLLTAVSGVMNGVYRMSADIEGLVETSNNLARVQVEAGTIRIGCLVRSSDDSRKEELAGNLKKVFEKAGLSVTYEADYPGWKPNPGSEILTLAQNRYIALFGEEPRVVACHAGLECGILGAKYPGMDMISFGPTIRGAHSPDERVQIQSVEKFWKLLLDILAHIPLKEKRLD